MTLPAPPQITPPLDPDFRPIAVARRDFRKLVSQAKTTVPLVFALERDAGQVSVFRCAVLPDAHARADANAPFAERLLKTLLWQRGAGRVLVAGPDSAVAELGATYSAAGARSFDAEFFGEVYARRFCVERVSLSDIPEPSARARRLGGDFHGCRIGFDAGGSDCKVAALVDGKVVFAEEIPWLPKEHSDAEYHVRIVHDCIERARAKLPRLDAIGVSSAGIFVENRTRIASLFRRVPKPDFEAHIRDIYVDLGRRWGVPVEVANDGDVAALAGALELNRGALLGLAFGTSLAAGYVDAERRVQGFLNELAFAPHDFAESAPIDTEWSHDRGTGVNYLSQDAALRLAPRAGIELAEGTRAERLEELQRLVNAGDARATAIFNTLGVYLGYALVDYAEFYDMQNVLLLGRVTSGAGGAELVRAARAVLASAAPELAARLELHLPDESRRRVGQAIAAASLPVLARSGDAS